jgi:hypothetical protein
MDTRAERVGTPWHFTLALAALTLACSAEGASPLEEENVQGKTQAITEQPWDRPAASAATITKSRVRGIWLFACDSANQLQRRISPVAGGEWNAWEVIDTGCASTPAVGRWPGTPVQRAFVYYRSTSNRLYEAAFDTSGNLASITDLSAASGVGKITGHPVYLGSNGPNTRRGVAVKQLNTNKLYSIDFFSGTWTAHAVLNADGTQVAPENSVRASYAVELPYYLSVRVTPTGHKIYARSTFADNFRQTNTQVTVSPEIAGSVSIGGTQLGDPDFGDRNECGNGVGCAFAKLTGERNLYYAPLNASTFAWKPWGLQPGTDPDLDGTPVFSPSDTQLAVARTFRGHGLAYLRVMEGFPFVFETPTRVQSAPSMMDSDSGPSQGRLSFYSDVSNELYLSVGSVFTDMGLQVLPP